MGAEPAATLQHGRLLFVDQARADGYAAAATLRFHAQRSLAGYAEPAISRLRGDLGSFWRAAAFVARVLLRHRCRSPAEHWLLPHQERGSARASGDPAQ